MIGDGPALNAEPQPRKVAAAVAIAFAIVALIGVTGPVRGASPAPDSSTPGPQASVSVQPSAGDSTPAATPAEELATSGPPGFTSVTVVTPSEEVAVGSTVAVELHITTSADVGSVMANLNFDPKLLQVEQIAVGPLWTGAVLHAGLGTVDAAVADANTSGMLKQIAVAVPPVPEGQSAESVDGVWATVTMKGLADGASSLEFTGVSVLDPDGGPIEGVSTLDGQIVVGAGGPANPGQGSGTSGGAAGGSFLPPPLILLAYLPLVLFLVAVVLLWLRIPGGALLRRWPYGVSLVLGLVPVVLFAGIVAIVVIDSLPAVSDPGLPALLGDRFAGIYSATGANPVYGLLPAAVGTVLITVVAMSIGLPVSLAMAIVSTEFPMGPVGRVVRPLIGILSGIPPIVYAVSVLLFVQGFMIPKFAADSIQATFDPAKIGADPATWPPADVPFSAGAYPWIIGGGGGNSTLLGGILIAMLLIPFMTPMIADAIRDVPNSVREASLALGANRGYTLRKAILPVAMPGIAAALTLGTLKAVGDIVIVSFAVGWTADSIPNPIFDVLERTPGLAAHGANMITPFTLPGQGGLPTPTAVGYVSALVLLLAAGAMVLLMTSLRARWRRRVSA